MWRLSACCSEETVNFYKAMGAKASDDPIPEIITAEPHDIQMTFELVHCNNIILHKSFICGIIVLSQDKEIYYADHKIYY